MGVRSLPIFSLLGLGLGLVVLLSLASSSQCQQPPSFRCSGATKTCKALIGYSSPNTTTLSHIQTLFQVKTLRSLLGVNDLPLSTPPSHAVPANLTVIIPFPCRCSNGTGVSNMVPQYTVVPGDGLYHIAAEVFSGLVTYPQIQAANGIKDANLIIIGQKLRIPLPCSCDDVAGQPVVHYGHVVAPGTSYDSIAAHYGTTAQVLQDVNGIDPKKLDAGQVIDVPLRACNSSVRSSSPDYPLRVANGTYVFTANNCVMCRCDATNNFTLQCHPSGLKPADWPSCPPAPCPGNLLLGNTTAGSSGCSRSACAYTGYSNQAIFASLADESTCPASSPGSNGASDIYMVRGWSLALALLCAHLLLLQRFL